MKTFITLKKFSKRGIVHTSIRISSIVSIDEIPNNSDRVWLKYQDGDPQVRSIIVKENYDSLTDLIEKLS